MSTILNIQFKKNKKHIPESSVELHDEIIQRVSQYKYFGIIVTDDINIIQYTLIEF